MLSSQTDKCPQKDAQEEIWERGNFPWLEAKALWTLPFLHSVTGCLLSHCILKVNANKHPYKKCSLSINCQVFVQ